MLFSPNPFPYARTLKHSHTLSHRESPMEKRQNLKSSRARTAHTKRNHNNDNELLPNDIIFIYVCSVFFLLHILMARYWIILVELLFNSAFYLKWLHYREQRRKFVVVVIFATVK